MKFYSTIIIIYLFTIYSKLIIGYEYSLKNRIKYYHNSKIKLHNNNNLNSLPTSIKDRNHKLLQQIGKFSLSYIGISSIIKSQRSIASTIDIVLPECDDSIVSLKNNLNQQIIIIGTAHISEESVQLVRRTIRNVKPDVVMIELDAKRIGKVNNGKTLEELGFAIPKQQIESTIAYTSVDTEIESNTNPIVRNYLFNQVTNTINNSILKSIKQAAGAILGKFLSQFYNSIEKLGFTAGGEFKAAVEEARTCGAIVLLGDRDVDITLQRVATAFSTVDSNRLNSLLDKLSKAEEELGLSLPSDINKEELSTYVEGMKQTKSVNKLMSVIKDEIPQVFNALIDERDRYMAKSMIDINSNKVIGIVGIAHMEGIKKYLQENGGYQLIQTNCKF